MLIGVRRTLIKPKAVSVSPSYDAATTAWANAVVTAGGTVSGTREGYIDTFIKALKAQSCSLGGTLWSNLDFLFVHAGENATQGTISLVSPATRQATNHSATFTANVGFTGNASSTYVDLGFNPSTNGVKFTQNSGSFGAWIHSFTDDGNWLLGATDGSGTVVFDGSPHGSGGIGYGVNDGGSNYDDGGGLIGLGYPPAKGLFAASRSSSASGNVALFVNNNAVTGQGGASTGVPSQNMFACGRNYFGGLNGPTANPVSLTFAASGFNSTDMSNFYTAINALASSVGF